MRSILISISLVSSFIPSGLRAQENNGTPTLWHTAEIQKYDPKKELSPLEAVEMINNPVYMELEKGRQEFSTKHFELSIGIKMTQLNQNTASAVVIGGANVFPTIHMQGTLWATRWLGIDAVWDKGILVMLGSKKDPNVPNSTLISPYWVDIGGRLRYQFGKRDGSSFMALRFGYHLHEFPVLTYPSYISKSSARGFYIGGQNRLSFNQHFGLDMGLDLLVLSRLLDKSSVSNSQSGIGFRFNADFVATIVDRTGLTTLISFGYGQTTYISNLVGDGVSGDSRSLVNADHFEQSYSDIHITFTARL